MKSPIDEIDEAILTATGIRWRKVALIVCLVADDLSIPVEDGEARLGLIGERIKSLADTGRLEARGDLNQWRFSEVRQPIRSAD